MKNYWWLLVSCVVLSCNNSKNRKNLLGSFVGPFGNNKITLLITKVQDGVVEGRSIVGGNDRTFAGTVEEKKGVYSFSVKEPGDDPNDGLFEFSIDRDNTDVLSGSWKPYDNNKKDKTFTLQRKAFVYTPDVGLYPEGSLRELKAEDVENLMQTDLEMMRNEIFARHGYCFRKKHLRDMFEEEDWYVPDNVNVIDKLTAVELKNLALIKRYEKYAEDYGDEFGR